MTVVAQEGLNGPVRLDRERWIPILDLLIEGGILLFVILFPIKRIFGFQEAISNLKWAALYLPFCFWILKMILERGFSIVRTPLDRPLLLYVVIILASLIYSIDRIETVAGIRGSLAKAAVLYLVILNNFDTTQKLKRLCIAFAVSFLLTIGAGFLNYQNGRYNMIGGLTAFGNQHHNIMGKILGGTFPFLLIFFSLAKQALWRWGAVAVALLGLFGVFMTLSRATWGGMIVTFLIWGLYKNWKVMSGIVVIFLFLLLSIGPDPVAQRWELLETQMGTISGRIPIWGVAADQIKERLLLGYGYGLNIFQQVYEEGRTGEPGEEESVPHEHNLFFSLLIQNGVIGLILYLWIFVGALVLIFRAIRQFPGGLERELLILILAGLVGEYFIHAMFDRNNVGNWALPAWAMIAMAMAILNNRKMEGRIGRTV